MYDPHTNKNSTGPGNFFKESSGLSHESLIYELSLRIPCYKEIVEAMP